jgi:hypothetical protein
MLSSAWDDGPPEAANSDLGAAREMCERETLSRELLIEQRSQGRSYQQAWDSG